MRYSDWNNLRDLKATSLVVRPRPDGKILKDRSTFATKNH